jgi:sodium-dependent dicarboxylate transporter 2/3/5
MEIARKKNFKPLYYFLSSFVVALGLTWLLKEPSFTVSQLYVLFLLFFSIGLWLTEAIPAFAVALFIIGYLVFALGNPYLNPSPEKINRYVNTFSSRIIWLLLGGFFLAAAMTKTELDKALLKLTLKLSGKKPRSILIAFMIAAMTFSMIMSATATTAMMIAALIPLMKETNRPGFNKALLLGISMSATIGGIGTIIGTSPNAIAVGILGDSGIYINFLHWMVYGVPMAVILVLFICFFLLWLFVKDNSPLSLQLFDSRKSEKQNGASSQRIVVLVVLVVTVALWLTSSIHGIPVAAIAAIPLVVFTLTGVLNAHDVNTLSWDTLILVAGGLSLGEALQSTGILQHYSVLMKAANMGSVGLLIILAYASMLFANFMSNAATVTILIPLGFALLPGMEKEVAFAVTLASSTALLLPVASPATAIAYSTGLLKQKDFTITGLMVGITGPILAVLLVLLLNR